MRQRVPKLAKDSKSKIRVEKQQATPKTTDTHKELGVTQQDYQKKRRSIRGDQNMTESGIHKLSKATDDVTHRVDSETLCDVRITKSLEGEAKPDKKHKEMCVFQPEITRNKRSKRGEKHLLQSGWNKNTLANDNSVRNLMVAEVDPVDGKICIDTVCEVKNREVLPSKSLDTASKTTDEHEQMCEALPDCLPLYRVLREIKTKRSSERRSRRLLERERKKLSNILINNHSNQNQDQLDGKDSIISPITAAEDNRKVWKVKKKVVQDCKDLVRASEITDKQEVGVTYQRKRSKEKGHDGQRNKNLSDSCCISDITEIPEQALISNVWNKELLSDDNHTVVQSQRLSDCANANLTNTPNVCNETKSPLMKSEGLKTYRRKDKNICFLANNLESKISKDQSEISDSCSNALEKKDEINSKNKDELNISPNAQHQSYNKYPEEDRLGQCLNISREANIEQLEEHGPVPDQENVSVTCSDLLQQEKAGNSNKYSEECSDKRSASRKTRKKDKTRHNSHQVNDMCTSDPPSMCPNSSSREGTTVSSVNEPQMKAIPPSVGGVSKDVTVGNDIIKDTLQKRSVSPETTHMSPLRRKLLILDLNGLLVDIVSFLPEGYKADTWISRKALIKRPFCDDFLKFCFETFDVGVWSSRTRRNVDTVVDFIMGDLRHKLLFCWDQYHCTETGFGTVEQNHKPMILKELKKVWYKLGNYNESNTILLDDSPYKALLNPPYTAIFPWSYEFRNSNDNALGPGGDIRTYLEKLAAAPHVQKFVEQNPFGQRAVTNRNPSWGYYLRVINANRFSLPT